MQVKQQIQMKQEGKIKKINLETPRAYSIVSFILMAITVILMFEFIQVDFINKNVDELIRLNVLKYIIIIFTSIILFLSTTVIVLNLLFGIKNIKRVNKKIKFSTALKLVEVKQEKVFSFAVNMNLFSLAFLVLGMFLVS